MAVVPSARGGQGGRDRASPNAADRHSAEYAEGGCPSSSRLAEFVEGLLSPDGVAELEAHLDRCADCSRLLAQYAREYLETAHTSLDPSGPAALESGATVREGHGAPAPANQTEPRPRAAGDAEATLDRGDRVERYVIVDHLGEGGMGTVYLAYDPEMDRRVALKLVRTRGQHESLELEGRERLLREARALARLAHPNVVAAYDVGTFRGQLYVAMEHIRGLTLTEWLEAERRGLDELLRAFMQAGRGLAAAHAAGLVHRDFKPSNVIVGRDARVRVLDFGLARIDEPLRSSERPATSLAQSEGALAHDAPTRTGVVMGTPSYMSPEQYSGRRADARSDQFSFCVALFEAVYGVPPFAGQSLDELEANVRQGNVTSVTPKRGLPRRLHRIILRGLSVDRDSRYPGMDELLADLEAALRMPSRRWLVVGAGALLVLGAAATAATALLRASRPDQPATTDRTVGSEVATTGSSPSSVSGSGVAGTSSAAASGPVPASKGSAGVGRGPTRATAATSPRGGATSEPVVPTATAGPTLIVDPLGHRK